MARNGNCHGIWRHWIAAVGIACAASATASAASRFWITPTGGSFSSTTNWSATDGGAGGATVPGAADTANFTLNYTYEVEFSATVTNSMLDVDQGNVTFDLNGNTFTLADSFEVEIGAFSGQTGRLTVRDGTLATDTSGADVWLGIDPGSTGFLTITTGGRLGNGTDRPDIWVGRFGAGTLTVNDNGRVDGSSASIGQFFGSTGTMTVTGPSAVLDLSGTLTVGDGGAGTMTVSTGGAVTTASSATLGRSLGADGSATVTGAGSSLTIGSSTTIGSSGDGTLTVSAGGLVSSTGVVTLGSTATGFGTASVTGANSRWNLCSSQTIGSSGLGVITVSSGGQVASSTFATLGSAAGGEGRVTVTGAGSRWALGTSLNLGIGGTGELTVSAGGEVSASSVAFGNLATGIGEATVTGAGSKLTTTGIVIVASAGTGTLNVASGGEVYAGSNLTVDDPTGTPIGTLNLDGGSIFVAGIFTNNGGFNFTDGLLQVNGSFQPSAAVAALTINGSDNGDLPMLELLGSGTTTNVTSLIVGNNHRGQLLLRQGRILNLSNNTIALGALVGGEGTLSVESGAQLLTTGFLEVGGTIGGIAAGTGTLNVAGGTVDVGTLELFRNGTVNLSSGTLAFNTAPVLDGTFNWTGGTLRFDAATSLTSTNVPKLLGLDATLNSGQTLASTAAVTLQTPLVVDGGSLAASSFINQSRLEIRSGSIGPVQNDSLLLGDGVISGAVTNNAAGRIRVDAGKTLAFIGSFVANAGQLTLQGGTLDFTSAITNSATGFIAGRGALYTGGLTNNGAMAFSGGNMDLHGDVTNAAGGRIVTSGAGSTTTFFDDVTHNGTEIFTGAAASTVIFGALSGAGPFTGTGAVYSIGDLRPGNSPGEMDFGGDLIFGPFSRLVMEIRGTAAGSQYDQINVTGVASLAGTLDIDLLNGFVPTAGNSFTAMTFASHVGTFDSIVDTSLGGGLALIPIYRPTNLTLYVALPGDGNLDGTVNALDYPIWLAHYNQCGLQFSEGDYNGDGCATAADYTLWADNFGQSVNPPSPGSLPSPVPEPATWVLLLAGACGCLAMRSRNYH